MTEVLLNTPYLIQSAERHEFLKLLESPDPWETKVGLYPANNDQRQHWILEAGGPGTYYIRSVAINNQYVGANGDGRLTAVLKDTAAAFQFLGTPSGAYGIVFTHNGKELTVQAGSRDVRYGDEDRRHRWYLIPLPSTDAVPTLKSGDYRIRSVDGMSLLTMGADRPRPTVVTDEQRAGDDNQQWTVTSQDTGNYVIQSVGNKFYLNFDHPRGAPSAHLIGTGEQFEWTLKSVEGSAWSIYASKTDLAATVPNLGAQNGQKPSLIDGNATPNQIWFFEKYFSQGPVQAKPEVEPGLHTINSVANNKIYMSAKGGPWHIYPSWDVKDIEFDFQYVDGSSTKFILVFPADRNKRLKLGDLGGSLGFLPTDNGRATEFELLKGPKDTDNYDTYYICIADSKDPRKVVENEPVQDINGNWVFRIDDMKPGDQSTQRWHIF